MISKSVRIWLLLLNLPFVVCGQEGDNAGEIQAPPAAHLKIPAAPPLSPQEALATFRIQPGFRLELVASEPMIEAPVAMVFDPDGRLWVVEMRGFMPNVEGRGETNPLGRVSVLEDIDGDGRMDRSTIFLEGLVMPRAIALVRDGVLVAEPPKLWFCRDTDNDGKSDEKLEIASDYATQDDPKLGANANPEHASNGLMWALDNWIYSANHTVRFRNTSGRWLREDTAVRGQWGITQDDYGRLFFNSNSDPLRADLVPSHYLARNRNLPGPTGLNWPVERDLRVWPIRVNPGVNRGYQKEQLRDNGTLATYTGACGPVIYRGDNFPDLYRGNGFVCEPTGNLIHRAILIEADGFIRATNAYDRAEFLASTDERFRPVNLYNGPDGALYVVDMYRGLIQHRIYLTTYLRNQVLERGLDKPLDQGRIYRIVSALKPPGPKPNLAKATSTGLVTALQHPSGWWRDTAQRLLIERGDLSVVEAIRQVARSAASPAARNQALWTLEGLGQIDLTLVETGLADRHPKVRATAIRLSESLLQGSGTNSLVLINRLVEGADNAPTEVLVQTAFTLGELRTPAAEQRLLSILGSNSDNALLQSAVLSGLNGRELEVLQSFLADTEWTNSRLGRSSVLGDLAQCIFNEGKVERILSLLEVVSSQSASAQWRQVALLNGLARLAPSDPAKAKNSGKALRLPEAPAGLLQLSESENKQVSAQAAKALTLFTWPNKPGDGAAPALAALTEEQQARFDLGKTLYEAVCAACHQPTGLGQEGLAPPLVESGWPEGSESRLIRILLHGLRGPLTIKNRVYELDMPPLGVLDDQQIAAVLTYIRRAWGHAAAPVEPNTVAQIRAETESREEAWTESELLKIP
jgi:mono/diheme cytochrome c family protein/glucose/arabinose dehydrogenase